MSCDPTIPTMIPCQNCLADVEIDLPPGTTGRDYSIDNTVVCDNCEEYEVTYFRTDPKTGKRVECAELRLRAKPKPPSVDDLCDDVLSHCAEYHNTDPNSPEGSDAYYDAHDAWNRLRKHIAKTGEQPKPGMYQDCSDAMGAL